MIDQADLSGLVSEYATSFDSNSDWQKVADDLAASHDWTDEAARQITNLVRSYGAFVLRNAAALAITLDFQDGEEGL